MKIIILIQIPVLKKIIDLMKDLKYEHQSIELGGWWGGWRVHRMDGSGVGGCRIHQWVDVVVVGCMVGLVVGGCIWDGCIYPPTHEQLQC